MPVSGARARTPYLLTVSARVCQCEQPPRELGRFKWLHRAAEVIEGYWAVYVGFFGDQQIWLTFTIVDERDGRVMWRNGRPFWTEEEIRGKEHKGSDSASTWAEGSGRGVRRDRRGTAG